ncbi:hypothetical protein DFP72DRAFT_1047246 [Ephemerocybe angulata]|uniref:Uncharacterized protein n=1 Tax=Ephemerocybe angulata TaxID=980116 RepID=A0A8H6M1Y3_9AGAR|nr:hypothetical protein DFP72DRAFT_1047246 [Tulosesus angulatus]
MHFTALRLLSIFASLAVLSKAYSDDVFEARDYIDELSTRADASISSLSTRELIAELSERLDRRKVGPGKPVRPKGRPALRGNRKWQAQVVEKEIVETKGMVQMFGCLEFCVAKTGLRGLEGGVSRGHDVAHETLSCDCLTDEDLEWETMSELGYLRFGYRLYVAYSSSERFEKRIRRGYAAGCHPEMEKAYPVPWPVPRIEDLQDELNAPPPTPPEILARVPAPLGPVAASAGDSDSGDMDVTETGPATKFHALPPSSRGITRESSLSTLPRSPSPDTTPEVDSTSFAAYRGRVDSPAPPLTTPAIFYAPPPVTQPTPTVFYAPPAPVPFPQSQFTIALYPTASGSAHAPASASAPAAQTVTFAASVSTRAAPTATATTPITSRIPPIVDHLLSEIDEVREALEAEREMRRLGDVEVRKLRDEIAEMRRMVKERVGRR